MDGTLILLINVVSYHYFLSLWHRILGRVMNMEQRLHD